MRHTIVALVTEAAALGVPEKQVSMHRRGLMTCEQTFGMGYQQCGDEESTRCYNPGLGQKCCEIDLGYCAAGFYCAPAAGFCCVEGETLADCGKKLGYEVMGDTTGAGDSDSEPITIRMTKTMTASMTLLSTMALDTITLATATTASPSEALATSDKEAPTMPMPTPETIHNDDVPILNDTDLAGGAESKSSTTGAVLSLGGAIILAILASW